MRQVRLKMFVFVILVFSAAGFAACNSDPANSTDDKNQLAEIAQFLEVEFPADAKIMHAEKNDRNNELVYRHIIYTPMPVKFKKLPVAKIPAKETIKYLKKVAGRRKTGKLTDTWKYCYEGKVKNGEWRAYQTNFENGSYLDVKQFYF